MTNVKRLILLFIIIAVSPASPANSDDVTLSISNNIDFPYTYMPDFGTVIRIDGVINSGLAQNFQNLIDESNFNTFFDTGNIVLSLNSPGGSFDEGILIGEIVSNLGISTVIEDGSQCLSACAIIFMSGRYPPIEGPGGTSRFMHINSVLGFHAPFIDQSLDDALSGLDRSRSIQYLREAYEIGVRQIGRLLSGYGSNGTKWPPSLMGQVLLTPPNEFRFINTIDDVGRWNISLIGINQELVPSITDPEVRFTICMNAVRWSDEEKWLEYQLNLFEDPNYIQGWSSLQELKEITDDARRYVLPYDNLNALLCEVNVNERYGSTVSGDAISNGPEGVFIEPQHHFLPQISLSELRR